MLLITFASDIDESADALKKIYGILLLVLLVCVACEFKLRPNEDDDQSPLIEVRRFDRLEYRYLTTADFSALQEMNMEYPMETRMLFEDILRLGSVKDPEIHSKFLKLYQDPKLQTLLSDVESEYANIEDLDKDFNNAFTRLKKWLPDMEIPEIYAQISALDQSVIIGNHSLGISLDKYMGKDYPLYQEYYTDAQCMQMTREMILPDALSFYLVSQYPLKDFEGRPQLERDLHMGKIQWVVNQALGRQVFRSKYVMAVERFMKSGRHVSYDELLKMADFSGFKI